MALELGLHQLKAIGEMKNGCILKGDVGTGKSRTALAYFWLNEAHASIKINGKGENSPPTTPKDIFIFTTAKKRDSLDWEKEAAPFGLSNRGAGEGADHHGGVRLTVESWNNIVNFTEVKDAFIIFDEQRLVGSGAWVKAFLKMAKNNRWIILSGTPGDTWMDYIPAFIANGWYKNRTEFLRRHVVYSTFTKFPKIDRFVEVNLLVKRRNAILVEMPMMKHTRRNIEQMLVGYDKEMYKQVEEMKWNIYENQPIEEVGQWFFLKRRVVNSDPTRLGAVLKLLETHPRLIVFYNFNYELQILRSLTSTLSIPIAEWNGQRHQEIPDTNSWLYLVQYSAGAEGWNCVSTNAMVFYSLNYSWKMMEQSKGRIDRMNTDYVDLYYYILRSGASIDRDILKALALKRNFNERKFKNWFEQTDLKEAA